MMAALKHRRSVQQRYVAAREVREDVLCLASPTHPWRRDYCAVLEVSGLTYHLKSEDEQQLITQQFQRMLCGLPYPLQILVRILPLDLSAYLRRFQAPSGAGAALFMLSASFLQFFRDLSTRRQFVERKCSLVVPATDIQRKASLGSGPGHGRRQEPFEQARAQLDLRCQEIARQCAMMGLVTRRLEKADLVNLEYGCLRPQYAWRAPLHPQVIEALGRPVQRKPSSIPPAQPYWMYAGEGLAAPATQNPAQRLRTGKEPLATVQLFTELVDLLAPASIQLEVDGLQIEDVYACTLAVIGLPRFVSPGWLRPLIELAEPMTLSFHLRPRPSGDLVRELRRRQLELTSSSLLAQEQHHLLDPATQVAQEDVQRYLQRLASGEERFLDWSMYVWLYASTKQALHERCERVRAVLYNLLVETRPALFEQDRGFHACQPHARDDLRVTHLLPSSAATTAFPFLSTTLLMPGGLLEGITPSGEPVLLDWWAKEMRNANRLLVAPSGAGKSFKTKLDILRWHLLMTCAGLRADGLHSCIPTHQQIVIDPEREYLRLAATFGGQWIRLAPGSEQHLNPFDLPRLRPGSPLYGNPLADQVQDLQAFLEILLADRGPDGRPGTLTAQEKALLDLAIYETYRRVGITPDLRTHDRPAPLLRDLYEVLTSGVCGPDPSALAERLRRFVRGSLAGIFDGPTNVALDNPLVVFDLHDLESELRPIGFFLISNYVWATSFGSTRPRQLIVDELLSLYQYREGARFLETLFQRARKYFLGITGITQHPALLSNSSIPANCATQILMAQEAASLDVVTSVFKLSPQERQILKTCGKGDALLLTHDKRLVVHVAASRFEHVLATTDPRELRELTGLPSSVPQDKATQSAPSSQEQRAQATLLPLDIAEQPTGPLAAIQPHTLTPYSAQQNGHRQRGAANGLS
jgi:hypothetical protein